jgi:3-oxoacyl-[acyl-carrier protein] reductase
MSQPSSQKSFGFFQGRVVLVTGGASGIGGAIVARLVSAGAKVAVWDINDELLKDCKREFGEHVNTSNVDVSNLHAVENAAAELVQRWRGIDHLVNNAGIIGRRMTVSTLDPSELDRVLSVNIKSAFFASSVFANNPGTHGDRSIVNLSSSAARTGGAPGSIAYATTKGAISSFTIALAKELAPGIRVNALAPGVIDTKIQGDVFANAADVNSVTSSIPLGRLGTADEVANGAVWLLSDEARYVTGSILDMSGGR